MCHSRFNAFFLLSAFVGPPPVAALLTAFLPAGTAGGAMLTVTPGEALPPTFAFAVLRGDGDGWRSFMLSFSTDSVPFEIGGCGNFAELIGSLKVEVAEGNSPAVDFVVDELGEVESSSEADESNSTGLTRGVACTLVINFARSQYVE